VGEHGKQRVELLALGYRDGQGSVGLYEQTNISYGARREKPVKVLLDAIPFKRARLQCNEISRRYILGRHKLMG